MLDIDYTIKLRTKEERYLFIQTIFYLVCNKMVENYRQIIKTDILEKDKLDERTKFKNMYLGRFDGRVILSDIFKLMNPYAVLKLSMLYTAINNNWNVINRRRNYEITREQYNLKCLSYIKNKLNYTIIEKPQVDTFFQEYKEDLYLFAKSKFYDFKLPLYIQIYNDEEVNQVLFFLKNVSLVFSFNPFIMDLLVKNSQ